MRLEIGQVLWETMVRETRHLWVGNLPENVREEKIVEHFTRYGRVESVKILPKRSAEGGRAAFVDFVDIRSATKSHESVNRIGDRELRTDYNEPSAISRMQQEASPTRSSRRYERRSDGIPEGRVGDRPGYSEGYSDEERDVPRSSGTSANRGRYNDTRQPTLKPDTYHDRAQSPGHSSISNSESGPSKSQSGSSSSSSSSEDSDSDTNSVSPTSEVARANKTSVLSVKNLSSRSSDSSVREGLYHEFKKYGEVTKIFIQGQGSSRFAVVHFRRQEEAERGLEACQGKMFLGSDMDIQPWSGERYNPSDIPAHPRTAGFSLSADEDFDPACTRTLFVGNIEKVITCSDLREAFRRFGEIVDIDIKKQGGNNPYAFLQFDNLASAIQARRRMDREFVGRNRVKVGFGKVAAINTIWVGSVTASLSEQQIERHFSRYGRVTRVVVDRQRGQALVSFDTVEYASIAQAEMKGRTMFGRRVRVEFVSRDSRQLFYDTLQRSSATDGESTGSRRYDPSSPQRSRGRGGSGNYDNRRGRGGSRGGMRRDARNSGFRQWHGGQYDHPEGGRGGGGFHRQGQPGSRSRYEGNIERDDYDQELRDFNYSRQRERERERERAQPRHDRHPRDRDEGSYGNSGDRIYSDHRNDRWPDDGSSSGSYEESRHRKEPRSRDHHGDGERGRDYAVEAEGRVSSGKADYPREERKERPRARKRERKKEKSGESTASTDGASKEPHSEEEDTSSEDTRSTPKKKKSNKGDSLESKLPLPPVQARYDESPERGSADGRRDEKDVVSNSSHTEKRVKKKKKHHRPRTPVRTPEREKNVEKEEEKEEEEMEDTTSVRKVTEEADGKTEDERSDEELQRHETKTNHEAKHARPATDIEERPRKSPAEEHDRKMESWDQASEDVGPRSPQKSYRDERRRDWEGEGGEKSKRRKSSREGSPHSQKDVGPRSPRKSYREERRRDWEDDDARRSTHWRSPRVESPPSPPPPPPPPPPAYEERVAPSLDDRQDNRGAPPMPSRVPYDAGPLRLDSMSYDGNGPMRPSPHGASPAGHSPVVSSVGPPGSGPPMPLPATMQLDAPPVAGHSPSCIPIMSGGALPPALPPPAPAPPSNTDTLLELLRRYPVVWQGLLALKNDTAAVQMHYLAGNARLAELSLPQLPLPGMANVPPPIRIAQRMKLEPSQLDGVIRRMQSESDHCLLLALPCGRDPLDVHTQTRALKSGFISYLQHKQAAGIINVPRPGSKQPSYVLHIFPPCDFAQGHLARVSPDLLDSAADSGHLMVVVASV